MRRRIHGTSYLGMKGGDGRKAQPKELTMTTRWGRNGGNPHSLEFPDVNEILFIKIDQRPNKKKKKAVERKGGGVRI